MPSPRRASATEPRPDDLAASLIGAAGPQAQDQQALSYAELVRRTLVELEPASLSEHNRQADRLRRREQQLEQLSAAAADLGEQRDVDQLAHTLARHTCLLLHADYACVQFYTNNQPDTSAASRGGVPCEVEELPLLDRLTALAVQQLQPVVYPAEPLPRCREIHAALVVPVQGLHRKVIATLGAVNKKLEAPFGREDVQAAVCLGRIAATAVDRARLFQRLQEWSQSLEMLLSFNAAVNRQLKPGMLVRQLLENATRFLKADGGLVGLAVEPSRGHAPAMQCVGHWHQGRWRPWRRRWAPEQGIPGFVLVSQFPYFANDYLRDPLADPELANRYGVRRCVCVPIKNARDKVLGFFELYRRSGEPEFTWQDAAFLESLGNTAAVAIENARLLRSLAARNRQIKRLSAQYMHRLEEERCSISRELHDEAGQVLIGLKLGIQVLAGLLPPQAQDARQHLEQLRHQVNDAAARIKDLAARLRPPTLDQLGFEAALEQLAADCRTRMGLNVQVRLSRSAPLGNEVATSLYRIVQEALTNVSKHAGTDQVEITLQTTAEETILVVRDWGCGFEPARRGSGLGLLGIQERVKLLGGQLFLQSRPGWGTRLEVRVPRHAQAPNPAGR